MANCPGTGQVILNTTGILVILKALSLKQRCAFDRSFVLAMYAENPRTLDRRLLWVPSQPIQQEQQQKKLSHESN